MNDNTMNEPTNGVCPDCNGSGKYSGLLASETCRLCDGTGETKAGTVPSVQSVIVQPSQLNVSCENMTIVTCGDIGYGTKVIIDGKEFPGIRELTLKICCDAVVTCTIEFLPMLLGTNEGQPE